MPPEKFNFRLRFHLREGDCIASDEVEILIVEDQDRGQLTVRSGGRGRPLRSQPSALLVGQGYDDRRAALRAADNAKSALLVWAVGRRIGVNIGHRLGWSRGVEGPAGDAAHTDGIDVYEDGEKGGITGLMKLDAAVGTNAEAFVSTVRHEFLRDTVLSEKQRLAAELYCQSFFDLSRRSRFITLVTAVEALLEPPQRDAAAQSLVAQLEAAVRSASVSTEVRDSMLGSLHWLNNDSIGQTGRALCRRLLHGRNFLGKAPDKFFAECYAARSQILHNGSPKNQTVDMVELADAASCFVSALLIASFRECAANTSG
ncbi:MAG: hypothetical protein IPI67_35725 [Myxococcales bacterium]|nr:hypothetical protein [Myxococcales bacterium]